jgi:hypothetical protein
LQGVSLMVDGFTLLTTRSESSELVQQFRP